ncbi:Hypothetical protein HVR_LOCUS478 [uncultured virus]|nr:Hypothetical protein HVR_LOCUS478 [uncultured virus]
MFHFKYNLIRINPKQRDSNSDKDNITHFIQNLEDSSNVKQAIIQQLLQDTRQKRFNKFLHNYNDDPSDIIKLKDYLWTEHQQSIDNIDDFIKELASVDDIINKYRIINIEETSLCFGCIYNRMPQTDHMECSTGCLHDPQFCEVCSL